ncbi:MAG: helix-turn-helix transcriptional regulator [Thermodesulfobacteriota bacterium]
MSQREFAKRIGAHPSVVQSWESGRAMPGTEYLCRIKDIYNVSIDWLISGEGEGKEEWKGDQNNSRMPIIQDDQFKLSDLLAKTIYILESPTIYRTALAHNINAFHQAVISLSDTEERLSAIEKKLTDLAAENLTLKKEIEILQGGEFKHPSE